MQQSDIYYQHCLNMFRASLCPSSGEQRPCVTTCSNTRSQFVVEMFVWFDSQSGSQPFGQSVCQQSVSRLVGWLVSWLVAWLVGYLVCWLLG